MGALEISASSRLETAQPFIRRLEKAGSRKEVLDVLDRACRHHSFIAYLLLKAPASFLEYPSETPITATNCSSEFQYVLAENGELLSSLTHFNNRPATLPTFWSLESSQNTLRSERRLFEQFGYQNGLSIPVIGTDGKHGYFVLTGKHEDTEYDQIVELSFIANQAFSTLNRFSKSAMTPEPRLTSRELDCINWTAQGKTSDETASIIGISKNTVNHYLSTAAIKLDTVNKAHTVAKAMALGVIQFHIQNRHLVEVTPG